MSCATVHCHAHTSLDDFATALLTTPSSPSRPRSVSPYQTRTAVNSNDYFQPRPPSSARRGTAATISPLTPSSRPPAAMANVVLAKHLDRAPKAVQIQALELVRTRRIYTRTAVQAAPRQFLFVAVTAAEGPGCGAGVTPHLIDFLAMAHWHDPEDGFANLEDDGLGDGEDTEEDVDVETTSTASVVKRSDNHARRAPVFAEADLAQLAKLSQGVRIDVDVVRYQMNIVSFLRMHRAVAGGISPAATKHFEQLIKCLAPLHGLDYATPALVGLAAKKVYLHRIRIVAPDKERSMQWGSELAAVDAILDGLGPEDVIEDVLSMVAVPL